MKSATTKGEMRNPPRLNETGFALRAEDVGFEPTKVSLAGFQDRCTRPLCESSVGEITRNRLLGKIVRNLRAIFKLEVQAIAR